MTYYYNPVTKDKSVVEPSLFGLTFDKKEFISSSYSNRKLNKQIKHAHELSKKANDTIKENTLMSVYLSYGHVTSGFVSFVSQSALAKISKFHRDTVTRAVKWLRKAGLIRTFHRYKGTGHNKRRTTSKTVLVFFVKFCVWMRNEMIKQGNIRNLINCKINKNTGEIQPNDPNTVNPTAVVNILCDSSKKSDYQQNLSFLS